MSEPLTIVSVVFDGSWFWQQNQALVARTNVHAEVHWIVVDNGAPPVLDDPPAPGARRVAGPRPRSRSADRGSLHHAMGLEKGLELAETRYVALMDPDFYVMRTGWVDAVTGHMAARGLALFGAVWHPRWFWQYRGFPSVHFMIIDTDSIDKRALNLRPAITNDRWWTLINDERTPIPRLVRDTLKAGRCRDTGWRLRETLGAGLAYETLVPHYQRPATARAELERLAGRAWPAAWRKYPGPDAALSARSLLAEQVFDAHALGWEEFFWQDAPFGFHLRRVGREMEGDETPADRPVLERLLRASEAGDVRW